ncbi:MAG: amidase [Chloroflexi bacterium]|nr:amidase [Chloroflexota bacterium]
MPELYDLTLTEAADGIRRRALSPVELVRALLSRIEALEPTVHAWETLDAENALASAERRAAQPAPADQPLWGLPVGVKDIFYTAGLRTAAGFGPWADFVPEYDAAAVERLRAAGAIVLGKTVTTQFALLDPPKTRNPWNPERTPGGSSSGSGAAVGARMVPAALGSQTAGSGLRPAAYCGAVGFKPTLGLVSRFGVVPISASLDHVAIITRSVADATLLLGTLAGPDPRDPTSIRVALEFDATPASPPRIGLLRDIVERAESDVRDRIRAITAELSSAGATVCEVGFPAFDRLIAAQQVIMLSEAAAAHAEIYAAHAPSYAPRARAMLESGRLLPGPAYLQAQRLRREIRSEVDALLRGVDCLLLPTASNVAPAAATTGDPTFQVPASALGLPAITLPAGLNGDGMPIGAQLVGRLLDDAALLRTAVWCEGVLGPGASPPLSR